MGSSVNNIVGAQISSGAAITDNKLATISTAGKVATSAVDVGTGANQIVQMTAASKLPAVDGSLLTNLTITGISDYESKSDNTAYQAETDGFVCAYCDGTTNAYYYGYSDANANPTTMIVRSHLQMTSGVFGATITMPVKKGNYWKVVAVGDNAVVRWIPLGS